MTSVKESFKLSALLFVLEVASTKRVASFGPPPKAAVTRGHPIGITDAAATDIKRYLTIFITPEISAKVLGPKRKKPAWIFRGLPSTQANFIRPHETVIRAWELN